MKRRGAIALVTLCWLSAVVSGQTTRPSEAPSNAWTEKVNQFATALADPNGTEVLSQSLADNYAIRSFKDPANTLATLAAHTSGTKLLMVKAYAAPVASLASDVTAAVAATGTIPDSIRKLFVPADADMSKADRVASLWLKRVLDLSDGQCAAVAIYITADPAHPDSSQGQVMLVVFKGQSDSADAYHITQIVFGDPQQAIDAYH